MDPTTNSRNTKSCIFLNFQIRLFLTKKKPNNTNKQILFDDKFGVSELVFGSDGEQDKVRPKI